LEESDAKVASRAMDDEVAVPWWSMPLLCAVT
jgi:hypothetical protein